MIITTINDFDWTFKYINAVFHGNLTTAQKIIIVRFLINLENVIDI